MQIGFILDIIIAVLLVLTITYAVRLNQRLSQLRNDKNELQALAKTFADATVKAEAGIQQLKVSSDSLQDDLQKAEALRDDLAYLIERGGRTADQMAASVRGPKQAPVEDDFAASGGNDGRLIQEAIRAATTGASSGGGDRKSGARNPGRSGRGGNMFANKRRNVDPHETDQDPRALGGGLGGLNPEDRLLNERQRGNDEPQSVGDTDAARELLKALSSVK